MNKVYVERLSPSGAWAVRALVKGQAMEWIQTQTYYGYTKAESVKKFRALMSAEGITIL